MTSPAIADSLAVMGAMRTCTYEYHTNFELCKSLALIFRFEYHAAKLLRNRESKMPKERFEIPMSN
jgi:hypothetical protein